MTHRYDSAKVTTPSEREIVITRSFDAPLAIVWDAMTTPRHPREARRPSPVRHGSRYAGHVQSPRRFAISDSPAERFRRMAGRFTDRVHEVPSDAWDNPEPCAGWVARDVVRHMVEWMPSTPTIRPS